MWVTKRIACTAGVSWLSPNLGAGVGEWACLASKAESVCQAVAKSTFLCLEECSSSVHAVTPSLFHHCVAWPSPSMEAAMQVPGPGTPRTQYLRRRRSEGTPSSCWAHTLGFQVAQHLGIRATKEKILWRHTGFELSRTEWHAHTMASSGSSSVSPDDSAYEQELGSSGHMSLWGAIPISCSTWFSHRAHSQSILTVLYF